MIILYGNDATLGTCWNCPESHIRKDWGLKREKISQVGTEREKITNFWVDIFAIVHKKVAYMNANPYYRSCR